MHLDSVMKNSMVEKIEEMQGFNPASSLSVIKCVEHLKDLFNILEHSRIDTLTFFEEVFSYKRTDIFILPMFFDIGSKDLKIMVYRRLSHLHLNDKCMDLVRTVVYMTTLRLAKEKVTISTNFYESLHNLYTVEERAQNVDTDGIESDINELIAYYSKLYNTKYHAEINSLLLNNFLYTTPSLTTILTLSSLIIGKIEKEVDDPIDFTTQLITMVMVHIYLVNLCDRMLYNENRNNLVSRMMFRFKQIKEMI